MINKRMPMGHWKNFDNVRKAILGLEKMLGHFPTYKEIAGEYPGLPTTLTNYYGGLNQVAEGMGKNTKQKPAGYWTLDRTVDLCRKLVGLNGDLPTLKKIVPTLKKIEKLNGEYRGLIRGIANNGGINRIRGELGLDSRRRKNGSWSEIKVLKEVEEIVNEVRYFPTAIQFGELGKGYLLAQISVHGGLNKFRKKIGFEKNRHEGGHWNEIRIINELRNFVDEHGEFPANKQLEDAGYSALASAIRKNGGYTHFQQEMDFQPKYRPRGYWDNKSNVLEEGKKLYDELGRIPGREEIRKRGLSAFPEAARKHFGSLGELRRVIDEEVSGTEQERLTRLLDDYSGEEN